MSALLAVFVHAFIVQPHIHTAPQTTMSAAHERASAARPVDAVTAHASNSAHHAACVICEVMATSGQMAAPAAVVVAPADVVFRDATALAIARAPRALTHSWRSRAPPAAL